MNENFAKLIAIGIVAGVAKALFGPDVVYRDRLPRPSGSSTNDTPNAIDDGYGRSE